MVAIMNIIPSVALLILAGLASAHRHSLGDDGELELDAHEASVQTAAVAFEHTHRSAHTSADASEGNASKAHSSKVTAVANLSDVNGSLLEGLRGEAANPFSKFNFSSDALLHKLGDAAVTTATLTMGTCPAVIGTSEESEGFGCTLGCECRYSMFKTCWDGGSDCDLMQLGTAYAMGGKLPAPCVAKGLGQCTVATWVYVAGGLLGVLVVAVPAVLMISKKKPDQEQ